MRKTMALGAVLTLALSIASNTANAQSPERDPERRLTETDLKSLSWRSVGPANMGGRIAAIALAPGNSKTIYIGYATGGVWKSTNHGTTFSPVFDEYETSSIGSLAVCDAPPEWAGWEHETLEEGQDKAEAGKARIVWVGTGEGNNRNSSSWGHGVYRSTDAGASFTHLGLEDSHDIPALAVHPTDPDTCYIAALGHLWGPNETRGVYKTTDGGKTWEASLHFDNDAGACDVVIDPRNPDTVYAAIYARRRTPWSYTILGEHGGIYRSTNAGATWQRLTDGLPAATGRIGLSVSRSNPNLIMAVVESDEGGKIGDAFANRSRSGGVFRSTDAGDSWERLSDFNPRSFYFSRIAIDPGDDNRIYILGWHTYVSDDGGRNFRILNTTPHVDYHAIVIDPDDPDRILVGNDGGLYTSWDKGKSFHFHDTMAVGQFYNVAVDDSDPYRIGGGLQDNGTWIGPSENIFREKGEFMGRGGAITNADWRFVMGGDGFHMAFDPDDANVVYAEWQGGNIARIHLDTGQFRDLRPEAKEGEPRYRFNWNAPFFISPHDSSTIYHAGNCVFKLTDKGQRWERLSGDLSTQELDKMISEGSQAETYGTIVSLAESPIQPGMLWAVTDDGLIHISGNDGETWDDVTPSEVAGRLVSKIAPSAHDVDAAFVAVDGHMTDRFEPLVLMTTDRGKSWVDITGNLPSDSPTMVIREDPRNGNVLYVGTERSAYVSIDRGMTWLEIGGSSLPTVPVDDLAIQPRAMDLIAGTHGRSVWILDDISALSQLTQDVVESPFHLFEPMPGQPRHFLDYGAMWSDSMFIAANPPMGATIQYWVREYTGDKVSIVINDPSGHTVRKLDGPNTPGLNRVVWDLQADDGQRLGNPHQMTEFVPAGQYHVVVSWGDHSQTVPLTVLEEPGGPIKEGR